MTEIDPDRTLASIVAEDPLAAQAFERFDLDYCCNGDRPVAEVCIEAGSDVANLESALADVDDADTDRTPPADASLFDLADHVETTHHEFLRGELPELGELVSTVARVHGDGHPELADVEAVYEELAAEMREHIEEEETELFPLVRAIDRGESLAPAEQRRLREAVETFEADHAATADHLDRIADLTDGYEIPDDACPSYRGMLRRLERLERDTHMHVHVENNLLFPRAEGALSATA